MLEAGEHLLAAFAGAVLALTIVAMCATTTQYVQETLSTCQQALP